MAPAVSDLCPSNPTTSKWHAGAASRGHIPHGRGFLTSLGYFQCCEDHFKQTIQGAADYWKTDKVGKFADTSSCAYQWYMFLASPPLA